MQAKVDRKRFGPWALITRASSGIGREFARQIAAPTSTLCLSPAGKPCSTHSAPSSRGISG